MIAGHTTSDGGTGDYQLDVETFGGDNFIACMDGYGTLYPADSFVAVGTRIRIRIRTRTRTRTVGDVTLRALPFFRPLCHGPVKSELA